MLTILMLPLLALIGILIKMGYYAGQCSSTSELGVLFTTPTYQSATGLRFWDVYFKHNAHAQVKTMEQLVANANPQSAIGNCR